MFPLLIIALVLLSFVIAFALGLGGLGASLIYMLLLTVVAFIVTGKPEEDTKKLPDNHDERLTD